MPLDSLHFGRDDQGYNAFAPIPAVTMYSATLANGVAASITIPQNFKKWIVAFAIQAGTNVFVDFTGDTAEAPAGGTFAATTSTMNPGARLVDSVDNEGDANTISLITNNTTAEVTVEFYPVGTGGA
jgi:hypothetical protein